MSKIMNIVHIGHDDIVHSAFLPCQRISISNIDYVYVVIMRHSPGVGRPGWYYVSVGC